MKDREIYDSHWESALYYAEQIDEEGKKMPRLIDVDEIKLPQGFFEKVDNVPKFYEWLDKLPTVDAVPVIRCKDCVYCKRFNDIWYLPKRNELLCTRCVETYHTTENDYCSHGERRENEKDTYSI